jgi:Helix-turn-helix domain
MTPRYLKLRDVALQLGISDRAVRDLVKAGDLLAIRHGPLAGLRIAESDLLAFIYKRRAEAVSRAMPVPRRKRTSVPLRVEPKWLDW